MAEKLLKTRIQLKYDTLANWQASELALKKGEIAIAEIETADPAKKENPPVMFKVGVDGVKTFKELNWASALAADVYGWAKAATKPSYTALPQPLKRTRKLMSTNKSVLSLLRLNTRLKRARPMVR